MVDTEDLALQRMEMIQAENPGVFTRHDVEENEESEWAVVTVSDENGAASAVELIESDESWRSEGRVEHYNTLAEDGMLAVILPDDAFEEMAARLEKEGLPSISLHSYSDIGLIPRG